MTRAVCVFKSPLPSGTGEELVPVRASPSHPTLCHPKGRCMGSQGQKGTSCRGPGHLRPLPGPQAPPTCSMRHMLLTPDVGLNFSAGTVPPPFPAPCPSCGPPPSLPGDFFLSCLQLGNLHLNELFTNKPCHVWMPRALWQRDTSLGDSHAPSQTPSCSGRLTRAANRAPSFEDG